MAYQELHGSKNSQYSGVGDAVLASTPRIYDIVLDSDISANRLYSFSSSGKHPIKFNHYYHKEYEMFIQTATSFELDYINRESSISHTLVLSKEETKGLLNSDSSVLNPDMFMNGRDENFERPTTETLPELEYKATAVAQRPDYITDEVWEKLIFAMLMLPMSYYTIYIRLNGEAAVTTYQAVELMNLAISKLPVEFKKVIGFSTFNTEFNNFENINVYFLNDVRNIYNSPMDSFVFDFYDPEDVVITGIDEGLFSQSIESVRAVLNDRTFSKFLDSVMVRLKDEFTTETLNEMYALYRFWNDSSEGGERLNNVNLVASFYKFSTLLEEKPRMEMICKYWMGQIENARHGICPTREIYDITAEYYPTMPENQQKYLNKAWSDIFYLLNGSNDLFRYIFNPNVEKTKLANGICGFIINAVFVNYANGKTVPEAYIIMFNKYLDELLQICGGSLSGISSTIRDLIIFLQNDEYKQLLLANPSTAIIEFTHNKIWLSKFGMSFYTALAVNEFYEVVLALSDLKLELSRSGFNYWETIYKNIIFNPVFATEPDKTLINLFNIKYNNGSFDNIIENKDILQKLLVFINENRQYIRNNSVQTKALPTYIKIYESCTDRPDNYSVIAELKQVDGAELKLIKKWATDYLCKNPAFPAAFVVANTSYVASSDKAQKNPFDMDAYYGRVESLQSNSYDTKVCKIEFVNAFEMYWNKVSGDDTGIDRIIEFMVSIHQFISSFQQSSNLPGTDEVDNAIAGFIRTYLYSEEADKKDIKMYESRLNQNEVIKDILRKYSVKPQNALSKMFKGRKN